MGRQWVGEYIVGRVVGVRKKKGVVMSGIN